MELKKNPDVDLNNKSGTFLMIGFVVTLGLVLLAFTWAKTEAEVKGFGELKVEAEVEMEIPPSKQEFTPPPPPPVPVLTVVEDNTVLDETPLESTEVDENTRIEAPTIVEPEAEAAEPEIFLIVEDMPSFPGGEAKMMEFMAKNTKFPTMARENGITGVVIVNFVIDEKGNIQNPTVLRGIGGGCDEEAIRVLKMMPQWSPGKQRGQPVKVSYNLPFRFILK